MNVNSAFVILFLFSLACAAFFCSAETAFVGIQKLRLQHLIQSGHPSANRVAKIVAQPEKFLATVLLGINFFETAVATLGTVITVSLVRNANWAVAVATIVITVATMVFAELVPKSLAVRYGERLALKYVRPLEIASAFLYPLVHILNHIGIRFTRLAEETGIPRPTISEEEFHSAINIGRAEGVVEGSEAEMLHKVFEFTDSPASKIMVPRTETACVEQGTKLKDSLHLHAKATYSRFPVYKDNTDNVVGILHAKDVLLKLSDESNRDSLIDDLVRPAHFVPENKPLGQLLTEMRDGGLRIEKADDELGLNLPSGTYETVAGFILSHLGRIPKQGEHFRYRDLKFVVTEMRGMKIERVMVTAERAVALP